MDNNVSLASAAEIKPRISRSLPLNQDRIFFSASGVWFVVLTFVGFSRSFYLRSIPEPLPLHQIVHGVVYSTWVLLFLVQALLVSANRRRLHIAFGAASIFLLLAMIPVGFHVVLVKTAKNLKSVDDAGFNLTGLILGFGFAFAGLATRRRPFIHKRLMLFATLMLTVAATDRVALLLGFEEIRLFRKLLAVTPAIALLCYDTFFRRKFPLLTVSCLTIIWLIIWFVISDLIFLRPIGEAIIGLLIRVFVW